MKVEIVPYSEKYSKFFYDLNHDWLSEFFYVEEYDEKVLKNCKEEIIDKGGYIFFALYDGEVVGTMALIPREKSIYELNKMAVKKDLRGNGIGHQLIQFIIDYSVKNNFESVILYSNTVLKNSIHLYNKFGFKEIDNPDAPYKRSDIKMELKYLTLENNFSFQFVHEYFLANTARRIGKTIKGVIQSVIPRLGSEISIRIDSV